MAVARTATHAHPVPPERRDPTLSIAFRGSWSMERRELHVPTLSIEPRPFHLAFPSHPLFSPRSFPSIRYAP